MGLGPIFKHHHRPALATDAAADADVRCGYTLTLFCMTFFLYFKGKEGESSAKTETIQEQALREMM